MLSVRSCSVACVRLLIGYGTLVPSIAFLQIRQKPKSKVGSWAFVVNLYRC